MLRYRGEIDGLRAIAVLLVFLNHLGLTFFKGGFVGVDVFFVISGFLITSIISKEMIDKSFTFGSFYKKRVLRLAPAYLLVIFTCFILSYFLLAPMELTSFYKSVLSSLVFAANFFMWKEVGGYFSANAETIPLLHLWSLGVEEQFYIIWPTILMLMIGFCRKWIVWIIAICIFLGCVMAQFLSIKVPAISYFLLPSRTFELLIGASLAFIRPTQIKAVGANILTLIGLGLILFGSVYLSAESIFPGYYALLPCLGTALIIYVSNLNDTLVKQWLSLDIMKFFGKISYPLYLWHWPLIVFYKIRFGELSVVSIVGIFILGNILAYLTFKLVEKPIQTKYKQFAPRPIILKGYVIPVLTFGLLSLFVIRSGGLAYRFSDKVVNMEKYINASSAVVRKTCISTPSAQLPPLDECYLGNKDKPLDTLLVGDSHANHYANMINVMLKDANRKGYEISQSATFFMPDVERYVVKDNTQKLAPEFKVRNDAIKQHLSNHKYKNVILGGFYAENFILSNFKDGTGRPSEVVMADGLNRAIDMLEKNGTQVYIITGVPKVMEHDQTCPLRHEMFGNIDCSSDRKLFDNFYQKWRVMLTQIQAKHPNLKVIDVEKYFCDSEKCYIEKNGIPLYFDTKHINYFASGEIGKLYLKDHPNPFK